MTAIAAGNQVYPCASSGLTRVIRYTPAVTIVAAWMSAETGVGPAMASGSHRYSGSCADLPMAPMKSRAAIAVAVYAVRWPSVPSSRRPTLLPFVKYVNVPAAENARNMASMNPQSPTRLVMNAFLPADAFASLENQNEIKKYEHAPTPSHPRKVTRRLLPSTSINIENANMFMYTKNFENFGSPCM